jgi:hypothetical protein
MAEGVSAVIFEGTAPASPVEEMMARVRRAALLDNLEKIRSVPLFKEVLLVTNDRVLAGEAAAAGAEIVLNAIAPASFHFGRALRQLILDRKLAKVFYLSGAGCPLISVAELEMVCRRLLARERFLYANNTQSADMVAFTAAASLANLELPRYDNSLAMTLRDELGLELELMPQSLGLLFDLDTPADILVLGAGPYAGPRARAVLDTLADALDYTRLVQAKAVLRGYYREAALIGRVGAPVIERLNAVLKLRLRVFSEERGMKALGRVESGEVVSLLGYLLDHAGLDRFFEYLSRVADCAFIDSRVLLAHYRYDLPDKERFLSDLGRWEEISHPWLKSFTRAAVLCPIPVILGGHSLVSGSLWALACELDPERRG